MNASVLALRNVAMTYFPSYLITTRPDLVATLRQTIDSFLTHAITFDAARALIQNLIGTTEPLDQLNAIIHCGADPIPNPPSADGKSRRVARPWGSYEDQRLLCGIYRFGIENWTAISKFVGNGRSRSQCSQRWYRGLDPIISKNPWTPEEEARLLSCVAAMGDRSWTQIAAQMGNRSDVQCRYRYQHLKRDANEQFVGEPPAVVTQNLEEKKTGSPCVELEKPRTRLPPVSTFTDGLPPQKFAKAAFADVSAIETAPPEKTLDLKGLQEKGDCGGVKKPQT
jgi:hypothetical protein